MSNNNTAVGLSALFNNTASNNTAVGYEAGYSNTSERVQITAIGYQSLKFSTGSYNTAVGFQSQLNTYNGYIQHRFWKLYIKTKRNGKRKYRYG
jgi:trimeric autotransporter adhesin